MRLVAQILLSNTQRVCIKEGRDDDGKEIVWSAAMARLLLTACATSGSIEKGQNLQPCTVTMVADSQDESAVIRYRRLVSNRAALSSGARRLLVSFSSLPCQEGLFIVHLIISWGSMSSVCRSSNPRQASVRTRT